MCHLPALRKQCGSWAEACGRIQRKPFMRRSTGSRTWNGIWHRPESKNPRIIRGRSAEGFAEAIHGEFCIWRAQDDFFNGLSKVSSVLLYEHEWATHEFTNPRTLYFPAPRKQCRSWAEGCGRVQRKDSLLPGQVLRVFENDHILLSVKTHLMVC